MDKIRLTLALLVASVGLVVAACGDSGGGHTGNDNNQNNDGGLTGEGRIYGKVIDTNSDQPMEGVTITASIDGEDLADATTNDHGRFMIIAPRPGTYAVTARLDGYTYAQRKVVIENGSIEAARPMYLTPIDPKAVVIGSKGGQGENSDGSITIDVPAGALKGSTEMHFTPFPHGWTLPNDLPSLSHFTYACELSPEGQTFEQPVTLKIRNTRGFAPGTPIPVGIYDSHSLAWTHESMGTVSDDGQWVVFQVEHFSARDCNLGRTSPDGGGKPGSVFDRSNRRRTHRHNHPCSAIHAGSLVGVADGHLTVRHDLPKHRVLSTMTGPSLVYDTSRLHPTTLLWLTYDITKTQTSMPDRIRFIAEIGGNRVEQTYQPQDRAMNFAYLWNGKDPMGNDLPEGSYHYRMTLANEYRTTFAEVNEFGAEAVSDTGIEADELLPMESSFEGNIVLQRADDPTNAPLGAGWGLMDLYRVQENGDGTVWIRSGDGSAFGFTVENGVYHALPGGFSSLKKEPSGDFTWTSADGSRLLFNAQGSLVSTTDAVGTSTTYEYDDAGRLTTITGPTGGVTTLAYNGQGHLATITDPAGRATSMTIDDDGNLTKITNPDGSTRSFAYDSEHQMTAQTDAAGNVTQYSYDTTGSITRVDRPDGSHTEHVTLLAMSSDEAPKENLKYVDGTGGTYLFAVNGFGTRVLIGDPLGRTVTMERTEDDLLRVVARSTDDDMDPLSLMPFKYDDRGNTTVLPGPKSMADDDLNNLFMEYDDHNRMVKATTENVGSFAIEYQGSNRSPSKVTRPDHRVFAYTYDSHGLRLSANMSGTTATYQYDGDGNLTTVTDPSGAVWSYGYDQYGNLATVTDPDGRQQSNTYNQMNDPIHKTIGNVSFDFEYALGCGTASDDQHPEDLTAVADGAGGRTQFGYDKRHRLVGITDPLGNETTLSYDGQGRLTQRALANGDTESFSYNEAGQLSDRTLSTSQQYRYTYGVKARVLTAASWPHGTTTMSYDRAFRVTSMAFQFSDGFSAGIEYTYRDAYGSVFTTRLRSGNDSWDQDIEYEKESSMSPAYILGNNSMMGYSLSYDETGSATGWDSWSGWVRARFSRDDLGRLTQAQYIDNMDQVAATLRFGYSAAGFVTMASSLEGEHGFSYDTAGRMLQANHPLPDNPNETFTYDAAGNRRRSGQESEYIYDAGHRLVQDPAYTYQYDDAGNRILRVSRSDSSTTQYGYDAHGQLTHVTLASGTQVEYRYDAFAHRVETWVDGALRTRYIWHMDDVLAEFDAAGTIQRLYTPTYTPDRPIGVSVRHTNADLVDYYYAPAPNGTILVLLDENGAIVESYRYRAFGAPVGLPASPKNTRLFAGMDYDTTTGLYYVRARWYDPQSGQFLQPDPLPIGRALSPYDFAANRPWSTSDPYGYSPGDFIQEYAVKPVREASITEIVSKVPVAGSPLSQGTSIYFTFKDVITVFRSDDPGKAARDWYESQWWNPAAKYVDSFLNLGGIGAADPKDKDKGGSPKPGCMWTPIFGR